MVTFRQSATEKNLGQQCRCRLDSCAFQRYWGPTDVPYMLRQALVSSRVFYSGMPTSNISAKPSITSPSCPIQRQFPDGVNEAHFDTDHATDLNAPATLHHTPIYLTLFWAFYQPRQSIHPRRNSNNSNDLTVVTKSTFIPLTRPIRAQSHLSSCQPALSHTGSLRTHVFHYLCGLFPLIPSSELPPVPSI